MKFLKSIEVLCKTLELNNLVKNTINFLLILWVLMVGPKEVGRKYVGEGDGCGPG